MAVLQRGVVYVIEEGEWESDGDDQMESSEGVGRVMRSECPLEWEGDGGIGGQHGGRH